MAKEMKEGSETTIFLDKEKITSSISKDGEYQTDEIKIRKWDGGEETESYLVEIDKSNIKFNGVLNKLFEREGYGIHHFENGDRYFGFFKDDKRNFNGIYFWPKEEKNGRIQSEMYYGFWKDNHKNSNGIYIWLDEPNTDQNFDNANLEAYVGKFEDGTYSRGTYLQKTQDDYYLYYGKFTKNGLKNDDSGFFYSSNLDRLFHGTIINDVFVKGYIVFFDSDAGTIQSIVYANFDKDLKVTSITLEKDLQQTEKENESQLCSRFRDVILGIDYFGELYQKVSDISKFVDENMGDVNVFNDQEKFPLMIKLAVAYSRNNIDKDINSKVFENKF
jgi:hypothetical protein